MMGLATSPCSTCHRTFDLEGDTASSLFLIPFPHFTQGQSSYSLSGIAKGIDVKCGIKSEGRGGLGWQASGYDTDVAHMTNAQQLWLPTQDLYKIKRL